MRVARLDLELGLERLVLVSVRKRRRTICKIPHQKEACQEPATRTQDVAFLLIRRLQKAESTAEDESRPGGRVLRSQTGLQSHDVRMSGDFCLCLKR